MNGATAGARRTNLKVIAPCIDCCKTKANQGILRTDMFLDECEITWGAAKREAKCFKKLNAEFRNLGRRQLYYDVPIEYECAEL